MNPLYDRICKEYDATRRADPGISRTLAELLRILPGNEYLDLSCGTGNYTVEMSARGGHWTGIDLSSRMLEKAGDKSDRIDWVRADAAHLPFQKNKMKGVLCTLAIHHFQDPAAVFLEVGRILDQGRFIIFTSLKEQMRGYWLNHYFQVAMKDSIDQMPSMDILSAALNQAGFKIEKELLFSVTPELEDLFLYSGKHKPELYLSASFREGISTFSGLASQKELKQGLDSLARDIQSGYVKKVMEKYGNDLGDYLFVVAVSN